MPKRLTKYLNGFIEIEYFDMTPSEEIEWFNRVNGVVSFPSANHRAAVRKNIKNRSDKGRDNQR